MVIRQRMKGVQYFKLTIKAIEGVIKEIETEIKSRTQ